ncbi:MAG: peroxiredoxin [Deltaproteobacteria bacterium]|nr:peroxiredoxin [Deltaproteobacteria bacterium]
MARPREGELAPRFEGVSGDGQRVSLDELLKNGPVMVVFYPKDETAVCTAQLCDYRDQYGEFRKLGVQIVGVSGGSASSKDKFSQKHHFPFPLLADEDGRIAKAYGMRNFLGMTDRGNFLVGRDGKLVYAHKETLPVFRRKSDELLDVARRHFAAS